MRRVWMGGLALCCVGLLAVLISAKRPKPEIDEVPDLIGLPLVWHTDARGWEGWIFTGSGAATDVELRLDRMLTPRGWVHRGSQWQYDPPQPFWSGLPFFTRFAYPFRQRRENSPIRFTIESGQARRSPPTQPVKGEWTTVRMDSMHVIAYSGPGPYPDWRAYRPFGVKSHP